MFLPLLMEEGMSWYRENFRSINEALLNIPWHLTRMAEKYEGAVLLENLIEIPESEEPREIVKELRRDGMDAGLDAEGRIKIVYRKGTKEW